MARWGRKSDDEAIKPPDWAGGMRGEPISEEAIVQAAQRAREPSWRPTDPDQQPQARPVPPRGRGRRLLVWVCVIVLALVGLGGAFVWETRRNSYCADFCHEMDLDVTVFARSSHARLSCVDCHSPGKGPLALLRSEQRDLVEIRKHFTNSFRPPINAGSDYAFSAVANGTCDRCHSIGTRTITPKPGLIMDHKVHLDAGMQCTWCHNRTAHPDLSPYPDWMTMEACFRCHSLLQEGAAEPPGALAVLRAARPTGTSPNEARVFARLTAVQERQAGILANYPVPNSQCPMCHLKGFQLKPSDHLDDLSWAGSGHGQAYLAVLRETTSGASPDVHENQPLDMNPCWLCHTQTTCDDCHRLPMPHPADWPKAHAAAFAADPRPCKTCHFAQDPGFCEQCHHGVSTAAEWTLKTGHPVAIKQAGSDKSCYKCHEKPYCTSCHSGGKPASGTH
jgi:cytochrome c nitrite reductase small subunit